MKYFLSTLFVLFFSSSVFSQSLSLYDLENLTSKTATQFKSIVTSKGYKVSPESNEAVLSYYYETTGTPKEKFVVTSTSNESQKNVVTYSTGSKADFAAYKKQIATGHYIYKDAKTIKKVNYNTYTNKTHQLSVTVADNVYKFYVSKL